MNTYLRKLCTLAFALTVATGMTYADDGTSSTYLKEGTSYTLEEITDGSVASDTDMIITDYLTGTAYRVVVTGSDNSSYYLYYSWVALEDMANGSLLTYEALIPSSDDYAFKFGYQESGVYQGGTEKVTLDSDNFETYGSAIFVNNNSEASYGGAMEITSDLSEFTLSASFIGNTAVAAGGATGGALYIGADGYIGVIDGDFIGNAFNSSTNYAGGAAIGNAGNIYTLSGTFIENIAKTDNTTQGGAVYNGNTISKITADFYNNYSSLGGAIFNQSTNEAGSSVIGEISGIFSGNSAVFGGAIYNRGTINGDISAAFYGNSATSGGAIYQNDDGIAHEGYAGISGNITGSFVSNTATASGGAIYTEANTLTSGNISASFTGNSAVSGGAIYNAGIIGLEDDARLISGSFESNAASGSGGAIYNIGTIYSDITASFSNNTAEVFGGAIYQTAAGTIDGKISGSFTENTSTSYGGAIYSAGTIYEISADFTANSAATYGGAIYNSGTITNGITGGTYYGNNITASSTTRGGAIYNTGTINGGINATFTENSAIGTPASGSYPYTLGGAIANIGTITGDIAGTFTGNSVEAQGTRTNSSAMGGAIANYAGYIVDSITANFYNNSAIKGDNSASTAYGYGGAISNSDGGYIGAYVNDDGEVVETEGAEISGIFDGNTATTSGGAIYNAVKGYIYSDISGTFTNNSAANAGVIYNVGYIYGDISATFTGNSATSTNGGAIVNTGTITGDISVSFTENTAGTNGGAISNTGTIGAYLDDSTAEYVDTNSVISATFTGNSATTLGGAIYNALYIYSDIESSFISNSAATGGAIYNLAAGYIYGDISGTFTSNTATTGGAIWNNGTISSISANFIDNAANTGSAIYNTSTIGSISGNFIANRDTGTYKNFGAAVYNSGTISSISANFIGNQSASDGAAIYNTGGTITITGGDFIGNSTTSSVGGAIDNLNNGSITINSTNGDDIEFTGNTASTGSDAIANSYATLNLNAYASSTVTINDKITFYSGAAGSGTYDTVIGINNDASATGTVSINNTVTSQAVTVSYGTLELGSYAGTSNLYESYYGSDYLTTLEGYYGDYDYASAGYDDLTSYISATYGTAKTVAASSASFSSSTLTVGANATLSFKVSASTESAANAIVFSATTIDIQGSVALDLSEIYGNFTLTLTFSGYTDTTASDMYTFLSENLDVIFAFDTSASTTSNDDYAYVELDSEGTILAEYNIAINSDNTVITISGISYAAVPEPSTYAMIVGLIALGFAYYRRRKQ